MDYKKENSSEFVERHFKNVKSILNRLGIKKDEEFSIEELEQYLNDLSNLIDTGHFPNHNIGEHTFWHKDFTLKQFIHKGRRIIFQYLKEVKP